MPTRYPSHTRSEEQYAFPPRSWRIDGSRTPFCGAPRTPPSQCQIAHLACRSVVARFRNRFPGRPVATDLSRCVEEDCKWMHWKSLRHRHGTAGARSARPADSFPRGDRRKPGSRPVAAAPTDRTMAGQRRWGSVAVPGPLGMEAETVHPHPTNSAVVDHWIPGTPYLSRRPTSCPSTRRSVDPLVC